MTTFREIDVQCAVCGELQRVAELTSTSTFGPPDLDLRPAELQRSALGFTVQRCSNCGYCASSLGQIQHRAAETVHSLPYRDALDRSGFPQLGRTLFCAALVEEAAGDLDSAGWHFLEAAWACDDAPAAAEARDCRGRAIEMFQGALQTGTANAPPGCVLTLVADLLRRARRFAEAETVASQATQALADLPDDDERAATVEVAGYIAKLAAAEDDAAHCCDEIFSTQM